MKILQNKVKSTTVLLNNNRTTSYCQIAIVKTNFYKLFSKMQADIFFAELNIMCFHWCWIWRKRKLIKVMWPTDHNKITGHPVIWSKCILATSIKLSIIRTFLFAINGIIQKKIILFIMQTIPNHDFNKLS